MQYSTSPRNLNPANRNHLDQSLSSSFKFCPSSTVENRNSLADLAGRKRGKNRNSLACLRNAGSKEPGQNLQSQQTSAAIWFRLFRLIRNLAAGNPCSTWVLTHVVQGSNTCTTCTCVGCTVGCSCPSYIDKTITLPPQNWLLSQLFLSTGSSPVISSHPRLHACIHASF